MEFIKSTIDNITTIFTPSQNQNNQNTLENTLKNKLLSIEEIITSYGYPLEVHKIETSDGYILTLFRITGHKNDKHHTNRFKQPVLFQHGLLDSSDGWVCNTEENCLPFLFANTGFDVWLSNSRGNKHSKLHKEFSPTSYEFWSYSFHEMGYYDIPAIIDHIYLKNSSAMTHKLIYIGHSQGTCMLFSGLTLRPQYYKEKLKLFIALAPVARISNMQSTFLKSLETLQVDKFMSSTGQYELFPDNSYNNSSFQSLISKSFPSLSHLAIDLISDNNSEVNNNPLDVYLSHYPSGTSLKSMLHFLQNLKSGGFYNYDYKREANMFIYGQVTPLEYDLSKIPDDLPIMMIAGKEDKLATITDVKWLKSKIKKNVVFYEEKENMGHISFLMGKDLVWFGDVFGEVMEKYRGAVN